MSITIILSTKKTIRKGTDSVIAPSYTVHCTSNLNPFKTVDVNLVTKVFKESPTKQCSLDSIPTWLVDMVNYSFLLLEPYIVHVVIKHINLSPGAFQLGGNMK